MEALPVRLDAQLLIFNESFKTLQVVAMSSERSLEGRRLKIQPRSRNVSSALPVLRTGSGSIGAARRRSRCASAPSG